MSLIGQSFTVASLATIGINQVIGVVTCTQEAGYDWCFHILAGMTVISAVLTFTSPKQFS